MAKILLAEDDTSMCTFIAGALKKAGHDVTATYDGLEAFNAMIDSPTPFDLLVTDIVMPGMDGIELSKKAAKHTLNIKIMFITGFTAMAVSEENTDAHTAEILAKPFHLNDLVARVKTLLNA